MWVGPKGRATGFQQEARQVLRGKAIHEPSSEEKSPPLASGMG